MAFPSAEADPWCGARCAGALPSVECQRRDLHSGPAESSSEEPWSPADSSGEEPLSPELGGPAWEPPRRCRTRDAGATPRLNLRGFLAEAASAKSKPRRRKLVPPPLAEASDHGAGARPCRSPKVKFNLDVLEVPITPYAAYALDCQDDMHRTVVGMEPEAVAIAASSED